MSHASNISDASNTQLCGSLHQHGSSGNPGKMGCAGQGPSACARQEARQRYAAHGTEATSQLQKVVGRLPAGLWLAAARRGLELLKRTRHVVRDLHDGRHVAAAVAVVGRAEDGHGVFVVRPVVALHDKLVELLRDVLPKRVARASGRDAPAATVVWVRPQQVAHRALVWDLPDKPATTHTSQVSYTGGLERMGTAQAGAGIKQAPRHAKAGSRTHAGAHLLDAVERANVVKRVQSWRQPAVQAEDLHTIRPKQSSQIGRVRTRHIMELSDVAHTRMSDVGHGAAGSHACTCRNASTCVHALMHVMPQRQQPASGVN
eukprot:354230-Chlamydomonas_euryale.AAC.7